MNPLGKLEFLHFAKVGAIRPTVKNEIEIVQLWFSQPLLALSMAVLSNSLRALGTLPRAGTLSQRLAKDTKPISVDPATCRKSQQPTAEPTADGHNHASANGQHSTS